MPMRFVAACRKGHLSDVPWDRWAHSQSREPRQRQCGNPRLRFETVAGVGGGLRSLRVKCSSCGARRNLEGIVSLNMLKSAGIACDGRQPWQFSGAAEQCAEIPQVVQRGASNLYFSRVVSALDIPEGAVVRESEVLIENIRAHSFFKLLVAMSQSTNEGLSAAGAKTAIQLMATELGCAAEMIEAAVMQTMAPQGDDRRRTETDLLLEEYASFVGEPFPETARGVRFVTEVVDYPGWVRTAGADLPAAIRALPGYVNRVVLVHRLREVRALRGFTRIDPAERESAPSLARPLSWLPAMEVFGEGIFITLNESRVNTWMDEQRLWLDQRTAEVTLRRRNAGLAFIPEPSPRFLLLHTLAHLLIRQLSFECGYSASSLRERIYAADPCATRSTMSGVLIYTADADSEGSLGGLAREGRPDRFSRTIAAALRRAAWCSADPVCRELSAQGLRGLNRSACHACALVSETSCQCGNVLLDRRFVVGENGYFGDMFIAD